jgi:putative membrane protein
MMDWGTGGGSWWGISMMVLLWIGLIVTIVLVFRAIDGGRDRDRRRDAAEPDAHHILDARFARGEISKEEYEERAKVLSGKP